MTTDTHMQVSTPSISVTYYKQTYPSSRRDELMCWDSCKRSPEALSFLYPFASSQITSTREQQKQKLIIKAKHAIEIMYTLQYVYMQLNLPNSVNFNVVNQ